MRSKAILILTLLTVGCASKAPVSPSSAAAPRLAEPRYTSAPASALVFNFPQSSHQPSLDLSREDRQPSAFIGYETGVATSFYLKTDDRQSDSWGDQVERRTLSAKTGVTYR
jgi:hypothetical protein